MTQRRTSSTTEPTGTATDAGAHPIELTERVARLTDRRGVLRAAVVVAGAGALAACSSPPVPEAASPSSSAAAAAPSGSAGGGIPTSEIPVGSGKIFADTQTVITQPTAGTFKAFDAICPHQGCTVASFEGSQIVCPCHQSHFDGTTGDPVSGPAATGLTPKKVTVTGSTLTVS
jgi:nitrite reductase/ring-hydroxylating ferredoxin subunit